MSDALSRREALVRAGAAAGGLALAGVGTGSREALAVRTRSAARPAGVRLSFVDARAQTVAATWSTDGRADPGSVVQWGPAPQSTSVRDLEHAPFEREAEGRTRPSPGLAQLTHEAPMVGTRPGERVRYRVGRPGAWSPIRTFTPAADDGPFTMTLFGDHGLTGPSARTAKVIEELAPDLLLGAGDLSYADGTQSRWDDWHALMQPSAATRPLMCCAGNHEEKDFGGDAYKVRFSHPGHRAFYAFEHRNVAFVVSTGGAFLADGTIVEELVMLERELAAAALRRFLGGVDWVVVMQHFPIWTSEVDRGPVDLALLVVFEQMLQRYQVDLLLVGHHHFYERSKPMSYGVPLPSPLLERTGYVQITSGGAGKSLYDFAPLSPGWLEVRHRRYQVVHFDVDGPVIHGRCVATDQPGEILDDFTIRARSRSVLAPRRARSVGALLDGIGERTLRRGWGLTERQILDAA